MTSILNYIVWDPDLIICKIGPVAIRWYSTCWLVGLLLAYLVVRHLFRVQKVKDADEEVSSLFIYCFLGILIGARLGHCIFYEPDYFLSSGQHLLEMILPCRVGADGNWHFTGYEGLASHGGTIGIILAIMIYCHKKKINTWFIVDTISISVPITACFIRLGNLMNSEIIGKVTDVPWAFIFERVDTYPRHPGQLYEAIAYACFFFVMWACWKKRPNWIGTGFFFGLDLALIFTFRFFIEYTKEIQEAFESTLPIDMGQILSIPFIIIGIACAIGGQWMDKLGAKRKND